MHAGAVDGVALCRMFNHAIGDRRTMPMYLSSDHDPLFLFERWRANLRILDVAEIKTWHVSRPSGASRKRDCLALVDVIRKIGLGTNSPGTAGFLLRQPLGGRWHFALAADVGGFGAASKLAWQVFPTVQIDLGKRARLGLGYRALSMDYETGSGNTFFRYDVITSGPVIGMAFNF